MPEAVIRTENYLEGYGLTAPPAPKPVPMGFLGTAKKYSRSLSKGSRMGA